MVPVNWRAMETEELGSVYESLLELQPQLGDDGKTLLFASEAAEQKGNQRKTTGSYYTPDSLVQALLDTALDPVLDKTEAEADDPAAALLKLSVIDPACGSGHFLLAAARRIATRVARIRADGTPSLADFRHALRDVARSCLHGVDRNPMAVELTKVALWIETVDPGLPLGFFDAQIRCGDALLGVFDLKVLEDGIPDAAYKPLTGDDKDTAKYYARANRDEKAGQGSLDFTGGRSRLPAIRPIATEYTGFRALGEDTLDDIITKDRRFRSIRESETFHKAEMACDLYIAAFLLPKTGGAPTSRGTRLVPTTSDVWQALDDGQVWGPIVGQATIARRARAFHWPLEFPDVMQRGGFDVVLGNPPWERIKLQEQEFFAARSPEIANATNKAARDRLIKTLVLAPEGSAERALFAAFTAAKREAEASSEFARVGGDAGGRFALTGRGDVNTYALFAELFANLARQRAGVIVPTGIATDATTAPFFAHLVEKQRLARLVDFENRAGLFPAVDSRMKFALLTLGRAEPIAHFAFFLTEPAQLAESERNFTLSPEQISAINPNTKTAPVFRSRVDAELTAKIYSAARAFGETGVLDRWHPEFFKKMFDFGIHQDQLEFTTSQPSADHLPLYEAKMIRHFSHRASTYQGVSDEDVKNGQARDADVKELADPHWEPTFRCWTHKENFEKRFADRNWKYGWLLCMRDKTNATNERTAIFSVRPFLPSNDTVPSVFVRHPAESVAALLANLSSLVVDLVARQKVGGLNLAAFIVEQFPILTPTFYTEPRLAFITPKVLELTYTSHSLAPFARDLGHDGPPFAWDEDRRAHLRADLDAFYARAYGLTRDELRYILDPADVKGPDYPSETFRVLKEKEIRQHGEYRTQRLVLAAWDGMEADGTFRDLGLSAAVAGEATPIVVNLPPLESLPNGAWSWPANIQPRDRLRYAAQYALWLTDTGDDAGRARFLIASLSEPALLTPMLTGSERDQWVRLVGPEAQPAQGVVRLRPAINEAWRSMFETLLASGQLAEAADRTWMRGQHFSPAGLQAQSADAQRTAFAMRAIRGIDIGRLTAAIAQEDNVVWARFGHAA